MDAEHFWMLVIGSIAIVFWALWKKQPWQLALAAIVFWACWMFLNWLGQGFG